MDINGNLKTPCNIYGICGCKQSGKNTVARIWQLLDFYYKMGKDYWVKYAAINGKIKEFTDIDYVLNNLQFENKNSNWQEKSFAHSLKKILCILFGCTMEQLEDEEFKNSKVPEEWKVWEIEYKSYNDDIITHSKFSPTKEEAILEFNRLDNRDLIVKEPYEYLPTYREVLQYIGTDLFRNQFHPNWSINALFSGYKPISNLSQTYPNILITDIRFQNEADAVIERGGKVIKVIRYKVGDKVWFNDEKYKGKIVKVKKDNRCRVYISALETTLTFKSSDITLKQRK